MQHKTQWLYRRLPLDTLFIYRGETLAVPLGALHVWAFETKCKAKHFEKKIVNFAAFSLVGFCEFYFLFLINLWKDIKRPLLVYGFLVLLQQRFLQIEVDIPSNARTNLILCQRIVRHFFRLWAQPDLW